MLEYLSACYCTLLPSTFVIIYIFWYMFVTDRDVVLTIAEKFGKTTSYYNRKVVWIIGGSSGLGEEMAYELASVGAKLVLTARSENLLQSVKEACLRKSKGQLTENDILVLPFDVIELESHEKYVNSAIAHFGKIDIFVNSVGGMYIGSLHSSSFKSIEDIFKVNFFGGIHLTRILLKHFLQRKRGQIIAIASLGGKLSGCAIAGYVASKCAMQGFYESLRMEYNNENIKVTIVNPSFFESNITKSYLESNDQIVRGDSTSIVLMPTKRCAHLSLIAGANHLYEVWISYPPHVFLAILIQHIPDVMRYLQNLAWTKRSVKNFLNGKYPIFVSPWKPLFVKEN